MIYFNLKKTFQNSTCFPWFSRTLSKILHLHTTLHKLLKIIQTFTELDTSLHIFINRYKYCTQLHNTLQNAFHNCTQLYTTLQFCVSTSSAITQLSGVFLCPLEYLLEVYMACAADLKRAADLMRGITTRIAWFSPRLRSNFGCRAHLV